MTIRALHRNFDTSIINAYCIINGTHDLPHLHSFPTRRSSDLHHLWRVLQRREAEERRRRLAAQRPFHGAESLFDFILALLLVRSEEHTSELQSRLHLVCRLLLEKKK